MLQKFSLLFVVWNLKITANKNSFKFNSVGHLFLQLVHLFFKVLWGQTALSFLLFISYFLPYTILPFSSALVLYKKLIHTYTFPSRHTSYVVFTCWHILLMLPPTSFKQIQTAFNSFPNGFNVLCVSNSAKNRSR